MIAAAANSQMPRHTHLHAAPRAQMRTTPADARRGTPSLGEPGRLRLVQVTGPTIHKDGSISRQYSRHSAAMAAAALPAHGRSAMSRAEPVVYFTAADLADPDMEATAKAFVGIPPGAQLGLPDIAGSFESLMSGGVHKIGAAPSKQVKQLEQPAQVLASPHHQATLLGPEGLATRLADLKKEVAELASSTETTNKAEAERLADLKKEPAELEAAAERLTAAQQKAEQLAAECQAAGANLEAIKQESEGLAAAGTVPDDEAKQIPLVMPDAVLEPVTGRNAATRLGSGTMPSTPVPVRPSQYTPPPGWPADKASFWGRLLQLRRPELDSLCLGLGIPRSNELLMGSVQVRSQAQAHHGLK